MLKRKQLPTAALREGEASLQRQFVGQDPFTGDQVPGPLWERPGDSRALRLRLRLGRHALAPFNPLPEEQQRNAARPVRQHEQKALLEAAARRANRSNQSKLQAIPSYFGNGMNNTHQFSRAVTREVGERTRLTPIRDTAEQILNPRRGEGKLRALGRAAGRVMLRIPLVPGMMAKNALSSGGKGIGFSESIREAGEALGVHRKRNLLGKFAASTAVLWTAEAAFHLATMKHGGHVPMPDFGSIPSFIGSLPGAVGDTWQTAAEGAVKAPGAISDTVGDAYSRVHQHYQETKAPELPRKS